MERFNLKMLNEVEGKEQCYLRVGGVQYYVEIPSRFAVLKIVNSQEDVNTVRKLLKRIPKLETTLL
jgi:hypothetical protein